MWNLRQIFLQSNNPSLFFLLNEKSLSIIHQNAHRGIHSWRNLTNHVVRIIHLVQNTPQKMTIDMKHQQWIDDIRVSYFGQWVWSVAPADWHLWLIAPDRCGDIMWVGPNTQVSKKLEVFTMTLAKKTWEGHPSSLYLKSFGREPNQMWCCVWTQPEPMWRLGSSAYGRWSVGTVNWFPGPQKKSASF